MRVSRTQQWLTVGFGVAIATLLTTALLARHAIIDRVQPSEWIEIDSHGYGDLNELLIAIADAEISHQTYLSTGVQEDLDRYYTKLEIVNNHREDISLEIQLLNEEDRLADKNSQKEAVSLEEDMAWEDALVYREALERLQTTTETWVTIVANSIQQQQQQNGQMDSLAQLAIIQQSSEARLDVHLALQDLIDEGSLGRQWELADNSLSINNDLWLMGLIAGLGSISLSVLYGWMMQTLGQHQQRRLVQHQEIKALSDQLDRKTATLQRTEASLATELNRRQEIETTYKEIEQAKELTDLKLNFFSLASHELRTPLSAILVSAQLLDNPNATWSEAKRSRNLRRIQSAAKTMAQLLSDILLLTRAEAGKLEFTPQLIDLQDFCKQLVEEVKFNTQAQQHISVDQQGSCHEAYLDERLLRAMLMSLLTNAIKYSPPESEIQLTIGGEQGHARFYVSDQGIGVPAADQQHLFESFHRGDNVKAVSGTGLGLAVVKKCLELHGGKIEVESQLGIGTTFSVDIPWGAEESSLA